MDETDVVTGRPSGTGAAEVDAAEAEGTMACRQG